MDGHAEGSTSAAREASPDEPLARKYSPSKNSQAPDHPSRSWEVAYLFAFLDRFTDVLTSDPLNVQTPMELEQAFLRDHSAPVEPGQWQPSLEPIVTYFAKVSGTKGAHRDLDAWTKTFTNARLRDPMVHLSQWKTNLVKEKGSFWNLSWHEQATLMRLMADYTLCHSEAVRDTITDYHGKATDPYVLEKLGDDREKMLYFHIDDSPRVYKQGSPFKQNTPWIPLCSTRSELEDLITSLQAALEPASTLAGPFAQMQKQKSPGKATGADSIVRQKQHRALIKVLQTEVLPAVGAGEKRLAEVLEQRNEILSTQTAAALEKLNTEARKDSTRSRTRAKLAEFYDDDRDDSEFDNELAKMNGVSKLEEGLGRGKRRKVASGSYVTDDADWMDDSETTSERSLRPRRTRAAAAPVQAEWRGERRSNRISHRNDGDVSVAPSVIEEDEEVEIWSKGRKVKSATGNKRKRSSSTVEPSREPTPLDSEGGTKSTAPSSVVDNGKSRVEIDPELLEGAPLDEGAASGKEQLQPPAQEAPEGDERMEGIEQNGVEQVQAEGIAA